MAPCEFLDLDEENKVQESTIEENGDNNRDKLYKELLYTHERWILGEQTFPLWENIYPIIVSALFIIYFTSSLTNIEKSILSLLGIIFTYNWLCMLSRNQIYSRARQTRLKIIEGLINLNLTDYEVGYVKNQENFWNRRATWDIRKSLPKYLIIIWLLILIYPWFFVILYGIFKLLGSNLPYEGLIPYM